VHLFVSGAAIVLKSERIFTMNLPSPFNYMGDLPKRANTEGDLNTAPMGRPLRVIHLVEGDLSLKLMEMGCLPGQWVEIVHRASGGHALALQVADYVLALRAEEARAVMVRWGESPLAGMEFFASTSTQG
jgi:ferrous iron transport protein A